MPKTIGTFAFRALLLSSTTIALGYAGVAFAQTAAPAAPLPEAAAAPDAGAVQAVVVTGSRLANAGFQAPTPVTVQTTADLQKQSPATIAEALQNLPAFKADNSPTTNTRLIIGSGQIQPDLRGLGAARTLSLVNGRRYPGSSTAGTADMATIPQSMIDHVDVVTGGASAAYGSDAVSGVVNFVTNEKFDGFKGSAQWGVSKYGDSKEAIASLAAGHDFGGGKGHFVIGGDFAKTYDDDCNFYCRPFGREEPNVLAEPTTRAAGTPAQIWGLGVETVYTPGGVVISGPLKGSAFDAAGNPYQFQYGTVFGTNMIGTTSNYGQNNQMVQQLVHPYQRESTMLTANYELSPDVTAFFEGNLAWDNNKNGHGDTYLLTNGIINIADPLLPPSLKAAMVANKLTTVVVGRANTDLTPFTTDTTWATQRAVAGLRGDIGGWKWELYYEHGHTVQNLTLATQPDGPDFFGAIDVRADASGNPVCNTTATNPNLTAAYLGLSEPNCVPFNVFGAKNTAAAVNYSDNAANGHNDMNQTSVAADLTGDLLKLPAGAVSLATGVEWRRDSVDAIADPRSMVNAYTSGSQPTYTGQDSVKEAFAEIGVPLLKDVPGAQSLDLNGAFRRTDYSTSGAVSTWKYGLTWEPVQDIRFRATKSRDIRAPSVADLFAGQSSGGATGVFNPFNGQTGRIQSLSGGNPALKPEIADTVTAGIVLQPTFAPFKGFHASIDYFSIEMTGVIGSISTANTIQRCFNGNQSLCSHIVFDTSTFGIFSVSGLAYNQASLETHGYDIEVDYRVPLELLNLPGALNIRDLTSLVRSLKSGDGTVVTQEAGYTNPGVPKLKGQVNVDYAISRWDINLTAQYFGKWGWDPTLLDPSDPGYNPAASNSISRNHFPGMIYLNGGVAYDVIASNGRKLQIYTTINNLLNKSPPPIGDVAEEIGGSQLYDTIGRYYRFGVRFQY